MKKIALIIFILFFSTFSLANDMPATKDSLSIATPEWEDQTNQNLSGLYFELTQIIYANQYELDVTFVPYLRATKLLESAAVDIHFGSYKGEIHRAIYPRWHLDIERVTALTRKNTFSKWLGLESLNKKTVAWIRGYNYENFVISTRPYEWIEMNNRESGIKMLELDRIDVFLDDRYDLYEYLNSERPELIKQFDSFEVKESKLYVAFANTERGKRLAEQWDARMEQLVDTQEIKKLYQKYSYGIYPF